MSELKEVFAAYKKLSFTDRIVFYTTLSNTVNVHEDNIQDFLIETRICDGNTCIFCEGSHVVKNGKRKDGIQRFLCGAFVLYFFRHLFQSKKQYQGRQGLCGDRR